MGSVTMDFYSCFRLEIRVGIPPDMGSSINYQNPITRLSCALGDGQAKEARADNDEIRGSRSINDAGRNGCSARHE